MHFERNSQTSMNTQNERGIATSLYYASFFEFIVVIKYIEEHESVELNAIEEHYGSALQTACFREHLSIVTFLCSHDVDINLREEEFETTLNAAAFTSHQKIVQHLIDFEVDIFIIDFVRQTSLYLTSSERHLEIVKLLLGQMTDFTIPDFFE